MSQPVNPMQPVQPVVKAPAAADREGAQWAGSGASAAEAKPVKTDPETEASPVSSSRKGEARGLTRETGVSVPVDPDALKRIVDPELIARLSQPIGKGKEEDHRQSVKVDSHDGKAAEGISGAPTLASSDKTEGQADALAGTQLLANPPVVLSETDPDQQDGQNGGDTLGPAPAIDPSLWVATPDRIVLKATVPDSLMRRDAATQQLSRPEVPTRSVSFPSSGAGQPLLHAAPLPVANQPRRIFHPLPPHLVEPPHGRDTSGPGFVNPEPRILKAQGSGVLPTIFPAHAGQESSTGGPPVEGASVILRAGAGRQP